jgi:DNA-binding LacI/PurR family transcriptional regulator
MSRTEGTAVDERGAAGLCSALRGQLGRGRLGAGRFLPSVRRLSEEYKLAPSTVHRALKSLAAEGLISAAPRRGYRIRPPRSEASAGAPLAFLIDVEREHWNELDLALAAMLQKAAARRGCPLVTLGLPPQDPGAAVARLREARARGVILRTVERAVLEALAGAGLAAVTVDAWDENVDVDAVIQDGFRGAMLAARHLASCGHRRIAWLGYSPAGANAQVAERLAGAVAGLERAGRELPRELRAEVPVEDLAALAVAARELLSRPDRPDAVLALWQPAWQLLLRAAEELGLSPGRDFAMVGWSTEEAYGLTYTPLFRAGQLQPAVVWSVEELATAAIARLDDRLARPELASVHIRIPARLRLAEARRG